MTCHYVDTLFLFGKLHPDEGEPVQKICKIIQKIHETISRSILKSKPHLLVASGVFLENYGLHSKLIYLWLKPKLFLILAFHFHYTENNIWDSPKGDNGVIRMLGLKNIIRMYTADTCNTMKTTFKEIEWFGCIQNYRI